jgi:hypothetical protein
MLKNYFNDLESGIAASIKNQSGKASPRKLYSQEIARMGASIRARIKLRGAELPPRLTCFTQWE